MIRKHFAYYLGQQSDPSFYSEVDRRAPGEMGRGNYMQWTISLTLAGTGVTHQNGTRLGGCRGDLVITSPGVELTWQVPPQPARADGASDWQTIWAIFHPRPHWYAWLNLPVQKDGWTVLHMEGTPLFGTMRRLLMLANRIYLGGMGDRDDRAMLVLERALLALRAISPPELDERVQFAMDFINKNYGEQLTINSIAHAAHLSVSHLSALFQRDVRTSPIQVLEQVRLRRAQEMLRMSSASIKQIAAAVGYESPSYFTRRFRRHSGQTPKEFRGAGAGSK